MHLGLENIDIWLTVPDGTGRAAERAAVASLVSEALGHGVALSHRPDGSPTVDVPGMHISVSHCRGCAAIALARVPVGIDVETYRERQLARVAPRVLSEQEIVYYEDNIVGAWTLKEALYKAALTPGLDFRRDIHLPLDGSKSATVMTPEATRFRIVASQHLEAFGCYMSVVVRDLASMPILTTY